MRPIQTTVIKGVLSRNISFTWYWTSPIYKLDEVNCTNSSLYWWERLRDSFFFKALFEDTTHRFFTSGGQVAGGTCHAKNDRQVWYPWKELEDEWWEHREEEMVVGDNRQCARQNPGDGFAQPHSPKVLFLLKDLFCCYFISTVYVRTCKHWATQLCTSCARMPMLLYDFVFKIPFSLKIKMS